MLAPISGAAISSLIDTVPALNTFKHLMKHLSLTLLSPTVTWPQDTNHDQWWLRCTGLEPQLECFSFVWCCHDSWHLTIIFRISSDRVFLRHQPSLQQHYYQQTFEREQREAQQSEKTSFLSEGETMATYQLHIRIIICSALYLSVFNSSETAAGEKQNKKVAVVSTMVMMSEADMCSDAGQPLLRSGGTHCQ